ncbi:MAG TPA: hypothetical protein VFT22_02615 [Kofleriaceae bacterium]|nr:hypothetical protein [Kofleriaceae bacterium]
MTAPRASNPSESPSSGARQPSGEAGAERSAVARPQHRRIGGNGDQWFESEQPTRRGMIAELQRIRRRTRVRPVPVVLLGALVTAAIAYKIATRPVLVEAEVVLALSEGALAPRHTGLPVDELRAYVTQVLLPDKQLLALVEKYDLYRLRKKLGPEFALEGLRSQFTVQIWRNSFVYFDLEDEDAPRSARIGISVTDSDPDRAIDLAHDLASVAIETSARLRQQRADAITRAAATMRRITADELDQIAIDIARKKTAIEEARQRGQLELAGILSIDLAALQGDQRAREQRLARIVASSDALASQIAAAGLDMSLSVVDESRPERPTHSGLVLAMVVALVGTGSLIGAAMVLGAFDSRVHDSDDVARLGLPVLGHVPGFAGDHVGSMRSRSAAPARVPSFQRWRSHQ